ncbi:hypothetical protein MHU86_3226 [Fragilaria crotonensis]|nr:hypothetical protein MHU86_3226 [Fragilaria crotonensis]
MSDIIDVNAVLHFGAADDESPDLFLIKNESSRNFHMPVPQAGSTRSAVFFCVPVNEAEELVAANNEDDMISGGEPRIDDETRTNTLAPVINLLRSGQLTSNMVECHQFAKEREALPSSK